jgi:uncharacterized protein (TIGR02996 family)
MLGDGEALLRAVCENPADDTPRLVYADWLQENGQPERAEYIRFECEFPDWTLSHPRARELVTRSRVFDPFMAQWEAELPQLGGVQWSTLFSRGFIHIVTLRSTKTFVECADVVFGACPVDSLQVRQVTDRTVSRLLGSRYLTRLRQIVISGRYGLHTVRRIAASPSFAGLDSLCLWSGCTDEGAEALAASTNLGKLRCLSFCGHTLTDRGATAIAESAALKGVTALVLHGTRGLSPAMVKRLKKRFERVD